MSPEIRRRVRERAGGRCEYCRFHESHLPLLPFHVDHTVARQHQGGDELDNLVWACPRRNSFKGTNLSAVDPDSSEVVRLFDPRTQNWSEHFSVTAGSIIAGITPTGRATVWLFQMNSEYRVALRLLLIENGLW
jgi:hypothetical protein